MYSSTPCEAEQLPLSDAQVVSRLGHARVKAALELAHYALELDGAECLPDPRVWVHSPGVKIAADRTAEEHRVLCGNREGGDSAWLQAS